MGIISHYNDYNNSMLFISFCYGCYNKTLVRLLPKYFSVCLLVAPLPFCLLFFVHKIKILIMTLL